MLKVQNLCAGYGKIQVLWNVSLEVKDGQVVAVLGSNGAGKTTTVRTITGMVRATGGSVVFNGEELFDRSSRFILEQGIIQVPEGRQLFSGMTVYENLELGAYSREAKARFAEIEEFIYYAFPTLKERRRQIAGTLSGGEQQMLAVARALVGLPKLLILDEPSLGLAPKIVDDILKIAVNLAREKNIGVLLVEQDVNKALAVSDYGYVIENGRVVLEKKAEELKENEHVKKAYLGI